MKNWIWFKRIQIEYWWYNFKNRCTKRRYCNKDYHKMIPCWEEHTNYKGEKLHVDYLKCVICNIHYFTNKEQKDNYLRIKDWEQSMWKNFFDQMKPKVDFKSKKQKVKTL